jgi:uncharacterized membrane protein
MKERPTLPQADDQTLQRILGQVLRTGVLAAAVVVVVGAAIYLLRHGAEAPRYEVFHGEPSDLCSVGGIIGDVAKGSGRGIIQLGLLLLIATPVARVLLSLVGFARQGDRLYVVVSLTVLVSLAYSLLGKGP